MPRDDKPASWWRVWRAALSLGVAFAVAGCGSDSGGVAVTATPPDAGSTPPQYVALLPARAGGSGPAIDVNWSPDYKYASRGQAFGHGGYRG